MTSSLKLEKKSTVTSIHLFTVSDPTFFFFGGGGGGGGRGRGGDWHLSRADTTKVTVNYDIESPSPTPTNMASETVKKRRFNRVRFRPSL